MTLATGVGSMPGDDAHAYAEAVRIALGEVPDLPFIPELPGRGAQADMVGRALAVVAELGADLQPAGWRLTGGGSGVDQRRAKSLLAQDLDAFEEQAQELTGPLKIQVAGPWTLAATVERPRGDRVLADHGARRELAQALAAGLTDHIADVRRRVPGVDVVVQIDEPALPAVLGAGVPTASGFGRHRSVDAPGAASALTWVFDAVREAGGVPVVHCCAENPPIGLLLEAGVEGVGIDLDQLTTDSFDAVGEVYDKGLQLFVGVVPSTRPTGEGPTERSVIERVERLLDMLGLEPSDRLVLTPACGLAGADQQWAVESLRLLQKTATAL